jgi:hypothetical protein
MNSVNISSAAASTMLTKRSCLAATFLAYDEHEPFDRVVQASSLYRISVSTTRAIADGGTVRLTA